MSSSTPDIIFTDSAHALSQSSVSSESANGSAESPESTGMSSEEAKSDCDHTESTDVAEQLKTMSPRKRQQGVAEQLKTKSPRKRQVVDDDTVPAKKKAKLKKKTGSSSATAGPATEEQKRADNEECSIWSRLGVLKCHKCGFTTDEQGLFNCHICSAKKAKQISRQASSNDTPAMLSVARSVDTRLLQTRESQHILILPAEANDIGSLQPTMSFAEANVAEEPSQPAEANITDKPPKPTKSSSAGPSQPTVSWGAEDFTVGSSQPAVWSGVANMTAGPSQPTALSSVVNITAEPSQPTVSSDVANSAELVVGHSQVILQELSPEARDQSTSQEFENNQQKLGFIVYDENTQKFVCLQCSYSNVAGNSIIEHLLYQISPRPYHCLHCKKGYPTRAVFIAHFAEEHSGKKVECELHQVKNVKKILRQAKESARLGLKQAFSLHSSFKSCIQHQTPSARPAVTQRSLQNGDGGARNFQDIRSDCRESNTCSHQSCSSRSESGHDPSINRDPADQLLDCRISSGKQDPSLSADMTGNQYSETFRKEDGVSNISDGQGDNSEDPLLVCQVKTVDTSEQHNSEATDASQSEDTDLTATVSGTVVDSVEGRMTALSDGTIASADTSLVSTAPVCSQSNIGIGSMSGSQNQTVNMKGTEACSVSNQVLNISALSTLDPSVASMKIPPSENHVSSDFTDLNSCSSTETASPSSPVVESHQSSVGGSMHCDFVPAQSSHMGQSRTAIYVFQNEQTSDDALPAPDTEAALGIASETVEMSETEIDAQQPYSPINSVSSYRSPLYSPISSASSPLPSSSSTWPYSPITSPPVILPAATAAYSLHSSELTDLTHLTTKANSQYPGEEICASTSSAECRLTSSSSDPSGESGPGAGSEPSHISSSAIVTLAGACSAHYASMDDPAAAQTIPADSALVSCSSYFGKYHGTYVCFPCIQRYKEKEPFYEHVWNHLHQEGQQCSECSDTADKSCSKTREMVNSVSSTIDRNHLSKLNADCRKKLFSKLALSVAGGDGSASQSSERAVESPNPTTYLHAQPFWSTVGPEVQSVENDKSVPAKVPVLCPVTENASSNLMTNADTDQLEGEVRDSAEQISRQSHSAFRENSVEEESVLAAKQTLTNKADGQRPDPSQSDHTGHPDDCSCCHPCDCAESVSKSGRDSGDENSPEAGSSNLGLGDDEDEAEVQPVEDAVLGSDQIVGTDDEVVGTESTFPEVTHNMGKDQEDFRPFSFRMTSMDSEVGCVKSSDMEGERPSSRKMEPSDRRSLFYICSLCDFSCDTAIDFTMHLNSDHHNETVFPCYHCNYGGEYTTDLTNHMNSHTSGESNIYLCPCFWNSCNYRTDSLHNIRQHLVKHQDCNIFKCSRCKSTFTDGMQFLQHAQQNSLTLYTCTKCASRFMEKAAILHHWRTRHSGGRVFRVLKILLCRERQIHGYRHDSCKDGVRSGSVTVCDIPENVRIRVKPELRFNEEASSEDKNSDARTHSNPLASRPVLDV